MYSFSKSQLATVLRENKGGFCVILPELTSEKYSVLSMIVCVTRSKFSQDSALLNVLCRVNIERIFEE